LPWEREDEAKAKRKQLFTDCDKTLNERLTHSEVEGGILAHLGDLAGVEGLDLKPAIKDAFHYAKDKTPEEKKDDDGKLSLPEFRLFLQTLRQNFEYYQIFKKCVN